MRSYAGGAPSFGAPPFCGRGRAGTPVDLVGARFQHAPFVRRAKAQVWGACGAKARGTISIHIVFVRRAEARYAPLCGSSAQGKSTFDAMCAFSRTGRAERSPLQGFPTSSFLQVDRFRLAAFRSAGRSALASRRKTPSSSYIFPNVCITSLFVEVQLRILRDSPSLKKGSGAMSSARRRAKRRKGRAYGQRRPAQPGRSGNPA